MPQKLPRAQESKMVKAYVSEETTTVAEIAERFGVAPQTVYAALKRHGVQTARKSAPKASVPDEMMDRMARMALLTLIDELATTKRRVEVLDGALRKVGVDPNSVY